MAGPLLVVVGETASGKTALAMELAAEFDGELISADSWAVYRGFDIGTAKPSKDERSRMRFHLIDVAEASDGFSAAVFQKLAYQAIDEITARGKLPILVGGTGLYIDSILYDFSFLPPGEPQRRAELNNQTIPELLAEIEAAGISTQGIDVRNKRRLIRLLESGGQRPASKHLRRNTLILGVSVARDDLKQRVVARVDGMLKRGLEAEVKQLVDRCGWEVEPMKGIGYYEWRDYFDGSMSRGQTRERIVSGTMNLAKKQRTWFRRNNSIQWCANSSQAVEIATTFLNKNH